MIIGTASVTLIYVLVNVAYMFLLTPAEIAASPRVAADAVSRVLGSGGGTLISLAIFVSTFGVVGIYTLTAPRIYFAMANDGLFFKRVAQVHPRFHTPAFAIVAQSLWAVVLILFWGTFENLISYVVFTDWIFFGLAAASVFVFRRRQPDAERLSPVPLYPLTPLFFVAMSAWFVAVTLVQRPAQAWAGLAFLALGVPVYFYWKRKANSRRPHDDRLAGDRGAAPIERDRGRRRARGDTDRQRARAGLTAADLLDVGLIPAMDEAGRLFEAGEFFVPELLVSARAMKAAMERLEPALPAVPRDLRRHVAIGTVSGDLHDIGKNLVATMLRGGGFQVVDLGVDVTPGNSSPRRREGATSSASPRC